jgi:DNA-directed RNA polymerase specialized sigma24 family protein
VLWLRTRLEDALDRLDDLPRRVVWLRVVEGWEVEVIADDLGIPPGEVRALGRRGLAALRADLRRTP